MGPSPRPPRDVVYVYTYLLSRSSPLFRPAAPAPENDPSSYYLTDAAYQAARARLLAAEARILYALGFDTHVALPHPLAVTYLQALDFLDQGPAACEEGGLARRAIAYLGTALLSPQMLYLTHQPNALAVAAVYNAARDVGAKMPECEWWEVFDVDREELGFLVVGMRSVEGWAARMKSEAPGLKDGRMIARKDVEMEARKRGLQAGNGHEVVEDEETVLMRRMDERMAQAESTT